MVKCCHPLKSELTIHKISTLIKIKGIEGIPLIIRFKTLAISLARFLSRPCIEGIPLIIRFKTRIKEAGLEKGWYSIEGIPLIIRFKTLNYQLVD